jgi:hypothetical protein
VSDVLDQLLLLDEGRIGSFSTVGPASAVPVRSNQIGNELFGKFNSEKWYQMMKLNWNVWAMADTTTRSRTKCRRIAMAKRRTSYWPMYRRMNIQ